MPTQLTQMERQSSSMDSVMRAMCDQASQEIVSSVLPMFTEAFRLMIDKVNAQITVAAPNVNVAQPAISVAAPNVTLPDAPDVNVEVPGLIEFAAQLSITNNLLGQVIGLLGQRVTKTVKRDANRLIEQVVETRG